MMNIKIERLPLEPLSENTTTKFETFLKAVKTMQVNESFVYHIDGQARIGVRAAQVLLDRDYLIRRLPGSTDTHRLVRVR